MSSIALGLPGSVIPAVPQSFDGKTFDSLSNIGNMPLVGSPAVRKELPKNVPTLYKRGMEPPQKSWWENMTNTIYNNSPEWAKQSYCVGKVLLTTDTLEQAKMLSGKALINQAGRTVTSLATLGTYEADLLTVTDLDRANGYVGAAYGARMTTEAASGAWIGQLAKTPSYLGKGLGLLDFGGNLVQTTLGTYGTVVYGPSTEDTLKIVGGGSGLGGNLVGYSRWGRPDGFVNLASDSRTRHILTGDGTGGGHLWPGQPGKTPFPQDWSAGRIMHEISDVATDPLSIATPGRWGRTTIEGTRDGVQIRVILESPARGGGIVTGYPTNLPRNP